MVTFGIFVNYTAVFQEDKADGLYDDMMAIALLADRMGFDIVWVPEHHMVHMLQVPNSITNAVAIGQHVRCRVGTAVGVLPYRHPLMWAGEVAAADRLLDGRFEFGVARGAYRYEFERFGLEFDESKPRFEECLDILTSQWGSDCAVAHHGRHYSFDETFVWPRPVQKPHPPIWVGAQSEATTRWAAVKGFDVFNAAFLKPVSHVAGLTRAYADEIESLGVPRDQRRFGVLRQGFVTETESAIPDLVRLLMRRQRMVSHLEDYDQNADPRGFIAPTSVTNEEPESEVKRNCLFGTPNEVLEKVLAYESIGVDHLLFAFNFGMPRNAVLESIQLFAERVMAPYRAGRGSGRPGGAEAGLRNGEKAAPGVVTTSPRLPSHLGARTAVAIDMAGPVKPVEMVATSRCIMPMVDTPSRVTAIAISGGRIAALGDDARLHQWVADGAMVLDFGSRPILPGFIDTHVHYEIASVASGTAVQIHTPPCESIDDIVATLRDHLDFADARGGWLVGEGNLMQDQRLLDRRLPTRHDLDRVSTRIPIALRIGGHTTALNTRGLELAGMSSGRPLPRGALLELDSAGDATGVVREMFYQLPIPAPADSLLRESLRASMGQSFTRHGVTTIGEIPRSLAAVDAMDDLLADGAIQARIRLFLRPGPMGPLRDTIDVALTRRNRAPRDRLRFAGIKLFADGGL